MKKTFIKKLSVFIPLLILLIILIPKIRISLDRVFGESSGGLTLPQGGLGITTVSPGAILVGSGTLRVTSTTSPTVGRITATTTTATSTFAGGISVASGGGMITSNAPMRSYRNGQVSQWVDINGGDAAGTYLTSVSSAPGAQKYLRIQGLVSGGTPTAGSTGVRLEVGQDTNIQVALTVDGSSKYVGIGTTTPASLLNVSGTRPFFTLSDSGAAVNAKHWFTSSQGGNFYIGTSSDSLSATTTLMTITSGGLVGIGSAAPGRLLEISGVNPRLSIRSTSNTGDGILLFGDPAADHSGRVNYDHSSDFMSFWTNQAEKFRITSAGLFGFGTTTPNWQLQQAGTRPFHVLSDTSAGTDAKHWFTSSQGGNFYIGTSSDALNSTSTVLALSNATTTIFNGLDVGNGSLIYDNSGGYSSADNIILGSPSFDTDGGQLSWADMPVTANSSLGTIQSYTAQIDGYPLITSYSEADGAGSIWKTRVGIATTSPSARFSVQATSTMMGGMGGIYIAGGANSTASLFDISTTTGTATSTVFTVNWQGILGIGTTSPYAPLSVNSQSGTSTISNGSSTTASCVQMFAPNGTAYRLYVSNTGTLTTEAGACK